jgi:hypothetical protein
MNIYDKTIPYNLAMKIGACAALFVLSMAVVMKFLAPVIYGPAATPGIIYQTEAIILFPSMMIGMGFTALRAQSESWTRLLIRCFVTSLLLSCLAATAGVPIFLSK